MSITETKNMQFAVPQFTDVEDKLIGPLTLKQFLMMLATGGVLLFFWSLFGFGIIFFLFGLHRYRPEKLRKLRPAPFVGFTLPFFNLFPMTVAGH